MKKILFVFLTLIVLGGIGYKITRSLFTASANSNNNSFATAQSFATPTPGPGDVVINEINWAGSGLTGQTGQNDEWLELKNTTGTSINISGWKINGAVTGSSDLTISSGTIPAGGFFLISHFNETISRINIVPDLVTTDLQLDNSNAKYILKDSLGNIIDTADDGSGNPLAGTNGPPKRSMERKNLPGDGTLGVNWQNASTHTNMDGSGTADEFGTPKAANGL